MRHSIPILVAAVVAAGCSNTVDDSVQTVWHEDAIILLGEGGTKVVVAPRLQGRILDSQFARQDSVGWVCYPEIAEGEKHAAFNNFGGQDRFWLGPEAGQFGIYFPPGAKLERASWRVPVDLDRGAFNVEEVTPEKVVFMRMASLSNYSGTSFRVRIDREVGLIPVAQMTRTIGVELPAGVAYVGSYSDNLLTNAGSEQWKKATGLLNVWILGQFVPGPQTVVIAPVQPGDGPAYRDERYFGKLPPERLKFINETVLFRADAREEGKFGIPQKRTRGIAGSFDFIRNILVVVRFDVPVEPASYANSAWIKNQADPYDGDVFQAYNSDRTSSLDHRYAFYEMESVSPSKELKPGETVHHRHETYCFQGDYDKLQELAKSLLRIDLNLVRGEMP